MSCPTCRTPPPTRWKRRWELCRKLYFTRVAARLQQKGRDTPPGPLFVSTKAHCLQVLLEWAMLDSNQRPPPCKGGMTLCRRFPEFAKSLHPANRHILVLTFFLIFQDIGLGCCTVAAHGAAFRPAW